MHRHLGSLRGLLGMLGLGLNPLAVAPLALLQLPVAPALVGRGLQDHVLFPCRALPSKPRAGSA